MFHTYRIRNEKRRTCCKPEAPCRRQIVAAKWMERLVAVWRCSLLSGQAAAQCRYEAEAAGGLVFAGAVVLPPSQALHPGRHGGSGEPRVQQQEDRAYPHLQKRWRLLFFRHDHDPRSSHICSVGKPNPHHHLVDLGYWSRRLQAAASSLTITMFAGRVCLKRYLTSHCFSYTLHQLVCYVWRHLFWVCWLETSFVRQVFTQQNDSLLKVALE